MNSLQCSSVVGHYYMQNKKQVIQVVLLISLARAGFTTSDVKAKKIQDLAWLLFALDMNYRDQFSFGNKH